MPSRRRFLRTLAAPAATAGVLTAVPIRWSRAVAAAREMSETPGSPQEVARDEEFWLEIQQAFTTDRSLVNLNNGGVSPTPAHVLEAMKRDLDFANQLPVYNGWQILEPQREGVRARLARQWGVDPEEVAITRNASESLQILQFGHDLERGDEVLTTTQDYGRMVTTFNQRERREGIVMKQIRIPIPAEDDAEVVRRFEAGITDRTRLILMCHMINITGQILPVRDVVAMARERDIPVIIDGAHALAHFDFTIAELECDNYSTSLHKWLHTPIGNGLLYVRRDLIPGIWPLMAAAETRDEDIRKFEEIGTHPEANFLAIGEALTFHQLIGGARKEARLVYLRDYWARQLLELDNVRLNTSLEPGFAAGIANVQITDLDTSELRNWLWREHKIFTVAINHDEFTGLRVSPSVYTTIEELDRFVDAMTHAARHGIAA
ncbi:MAG: aminotransferase class V-fold PLP-dependent enzyme [Gemmatimonadota bacterium]|nr:aminotransferase class V-fold PLP-dependent enzyme [Gemmatimonadota bacterium]